MSEHDLLKAFFGDDPFVHIDMSPKGNDFVEAGADGTTATIWTQWGHPDTFLQGGAAGWLPIIFRHGDGLTAKEQIELRYQHGGGYRPAPEKLKLGIDACLHYPGDDPFNPIAETTLDTGEHLTIFEGSWLLIRSPDNASYAVVGMD
jgi:hypothetical protein